MTRTAPAGTLVFVHRRAVLSFLATSPFWSCPARAAARSAWLDHSLRGPDGASTSLAKRAAGDRLVVVTMKGHWCPVCLAQLARLAAVKSRLVNLRTRVVGLNTDSPKANAEAARATGIPVAILTDPRHGVLEALDLWRPAAGQPMPAIVVFDECGTERARFVGRRPGERVEGRLLAELERIVAAPPHCDRRPNA